MNPLPRRGARSTGREQLSKADVTLSDAIDRYIEEKKTISRTKAGRQPKGADGRQLCVPPCSHLHALLSPMGLRA